MSADSFSKISAADAFSAGAELWIIEDNFNDHWWNEIDFRSGFLLSASLYHHKQPLPSQINNLVAATELKSYTFNEDQNILLLGTAQHFLNHWILVWKNNPEAVAEKLAQLSQTLKVKNIRLFSENKTLNQLLSTRLSASFEQISIVESL